MIADITPEMLVLAALELPLAAALLIPLFHRAPNLREAVTLAASAGLLFVVWSLLPHILSGARPEVSVYQVTPGLELAFKVEPLGMLFALVAGTLWIVNSVYSIGYMRGGAEPRQTSYYVCFAVALAATMGIAFAKNLFTLFIFYEALTLSTYPLVTHKGTPEAMRGGRIYLVLLLGTSMGLLLPAIVATAVIAGTLDFMPGGILGGKVGAGVFGLLLALYVFGIGKAALMPFHFWLPAAMVAPTPVSALLHAVAVVKAGVFCILKVFIYVFGLDLLANTGASEWLIYVAAFTLIAASLVALRQDDLKARLAYSTVSQLSYIVLGALLASTTSVIGAGMHIAMHATGKITLFFCAGAIYVAAHKTKISELDGIGYKMPITMTAFLIGALSIVGVPPLGGAWSKWYLGIGAVDAGQLFVVAVLMISSLLNVAYLLSIVGRAFFLPARGVQAHAVGAMAVNNGRTIEEAPTACLIALCATALMCFALFFAAGFVEQLVASALTTVTVKEGS
jgi:multicomponent Na+:H+ antiporter subunit D